MKHPIIIEGKSFPWDEPNPYGNVVDSEGEVNFMAAACADPGVTKCPGCSQFLWREGEKVQCPDCATVFDIAS